MEDSLELDVRALFGGGNLLEGHGCGGDGGVGPTCVSYLRGVGAAGGTRVGDTTSTTEGGAATAATAGSVAGWDAVAASSEDGLTRGL